MTTSNSQFSGRYERHDGSPLWIIAVGSGLVLLLVAGVVTGGWIFIAHASARVTSPPATSKNSFEHGPFERTGIERDREIQDAAVTNHLETYAWADRKAGVVHIPIRRAMELIANEEGRASVENKEGHP